MLNAPTVIVGCEFSGKVREAFKKIGWNAWSCDLLPTEFPGQHIQGDVLDYIDNNPYNNNDGWDLGIFHPPCTHTAVSGARWFKFKQKEQKEAIEFFMKLVGAPIPRIAIEQPISIMSSIYRKPDQIIQPYQFGHGETKATCFWYKNLPLLKPTNIVEGRLNRVHKEPPNPERWKNRSRTYDGIAEAMAEQWGGLLNETTTAPIPPTPKGVGILGAIL